MQKITNIKYIVPSLSFILLASSAMAMDPAEQDKVAGTTLAQPAVQHDDNATQTNSITVTEYASKEPEFEEVEIDVTRSWLNPAWIVKGGTYKVKVQQKKAALAPTTTESDASTTQAAVPPGEQQADKQAAPPAVNVEAPPVEEAAPPAVNDQKQGEEAKAPQGYYRSYLNPRRYTQGAWVSTEPAPTETQTVVTQAAEPLLVDRQPGDQQGDKQAQPPAANHQQSNLTDTFFGSAARVYEAAEGNPEAKRLLDEALALIAQQDEEKK